MVDSTVGNIAHTPVPRFVGCTDDEVVVDKALFDVSASLHISLSRSSNGLNLRPFSPDFAWDVNGVARVHPCASDGLLVSIDAVLLCALCKILLNMERVGLVSVVGGAFIECCLMANELELFLVNCGVCSIESALGLLLSSSKIESKCTLLE